MRLADFVVALFAQPGDRPRCAALGIVGEVAGTWGAVLLLQPKAAATSAAVACTVGPANAFALGKVVQHLTKSRADRTIRTHGCAVLPLRRSGDLIGYFVTDGERGLDRAELDEMLEILSGLLELAPAPARNAAMALRGVPDPTRRAAIKEALRESAGNVSRTAIRLGIARRTLYVQMHRLGISRERER